jgi:hypothetical protein
MGVVRCVYCGEIVGVYERAPVIAREGQVREGSPLTLGDELTPGAAVLHEHCFFARGEREHGAEGPRPSL